MAFSQISAGCCEIKVGLISQSQGKFRVKMKGEKNQFVSVWLMSNLLRMNDKLTTDGTEFYASSLIPLKLYGEVSQAHSIWGTHQVPPLG